MTEPKAMPVIRASMMFDHPAWVPDAGGAAHRALRQGSGVLLVVAAVVERAHQIESTVIKGAGVPPSVIVVDPEVLDGPTELVEPLREVGRVARVGNPDLWDALATSILRQVIRAGQARRLYRVVCQTLGEQVHTAHGTSNLFPAPRVLLALPASEFARLGLGFKRQTLQAAARAYLDHGAVWAGLSPTELVTALQRIPRIGPWTAGAAVADMTNDFALYPFADLAVRTWASRLAPGLPWPPRESEFARTWRELAGNQLSTWTLLTLAWGVRNARKERAVAL